MITNQLAYWQSNILYLVVLVWSAYFTWRCVHRSAASPAPINRAKQLYGLMFPKHDPISLKQAGVPLSTLELLGWTSIFLALSLGAYLSHGLVIAYDVYFVTEYLNQGGFSKTLKLKLGLPEPEYLLPAAFNSLGLNINHSFLISQTLYRAVPFALFLVAPIGPLGALGRRILLTVWTLSPIVMNSGVIHNNNLHLNSIGQSEDLFALMMCVVAMTLVVQKQRTVLIWLGFGLSIGLATMAKGTGATWVAAFLLAWWATSLKYADLKWAPVWVGLGLTIGYYEFWNEWLTPVTHASHTADEFLGFFHATRAEGLQSHGFRPDTTLDDVIHNRLNWQLPLDFAAEAGDLFVKQFRSVGILSTSPLLAFLFLAVGFRFMLKETDAFLKTLAITTLLVPMFVLSFSNTEKGESEHFIFLSLFFLFVYGAAGIEKMALRLQEVWPPLETEKERRWVNVASFATVTVLAVTSLSGITYKTSASYGRAWSLEANFYGRLMDARTNLYNAIETNLGPNGILLCNGGSIMNSWDKDYAVESSFALHQNMLNKGALEETTLAKALISNLSPHYTAVAIVIDNSIMGGTADNLAWDGKIPQLPKWLVHQKTIQVDSVNLQLFEFSWYRPNALVDIGTKRFGAQHTDQLSEAQNAWDNKAFATTRDILQPLRKKHPDDPFLARYFHQ